MRHHERLARRKRGAYRRNGGMGIPVAGANIEEVDRRVTNPKPATGMLKKRLNPKHCAWSEMHVKGT
jgi:hypothetical protein